MLDAYYKKDIAYRYRNTDLRFAVGHTLFSSFDIDHGTDVFLRSLEPANAATILDLGCGYGPIGICLAKAYPEARVVMADKDLLALRYARHNLRLNGLDEAAGRVSVFGSVGTESVPDLPYTLICSNVPAKIGDAAIEEEFVLKPYGRLAPGGEYWFVIVSALNHLIPRLGTKHELHLREMRKRSGHSVYRVTKPA